MASDVFFSSVEDATTSHIYQLGLVYALKSYKQFLAVSKARHVIEA